MENSLGEQISFFHLDSLSSDVRLNVDFDLTLTVVADLLYQGLGRRLKRFDRASPHKLSRKFVDTTGSVEIEQEQVRVCLAKRAHNPILKAAGLAGPTPVVPCRGKSAGERIDVSEADAQTLIGQGIADGVQKAVEDQLKSFARAQSLSRKNGTPLIFGEGGEGDTRGQDVRRLAPVRPPQQPEEAGRGLRLRQRLPTSCVFPRRSAGGPGPGPRWWPT